MEDGEWSIETTVREGKGSGADRRERNERCYRVDAEQQLTKIVVMMQSVQATEELRRTATSEGKRLQTEPIVQGCTRNTNRAAQ